VSAVIIKLMVVVAVAVETVEVVLARAARVSMGVSLLSADSRHHQVPGLTQHIVRRYIHQLRFEWWI
jgi:hypothetical protein